MTASSEIASNEWNSSFESEPFTVVSSNEWYLALDGDSESKATRTVAKSNFLANDTIRYPELSYPRLEDIDMVSIEQHLQRLLAESQIGADESTADMRYEQAARKLAELYRHKEVMRRLGWSADQGLSRERAGSMTIELFGSVETESFAHLINNLRNVAAKFSNESIEARELLEMIGNIAPSSNEPDYEISQVAIEHIRHDLFVVFPGLEETIENVPAPGVDVEARADYMQKIIDCASGNSSAQLRIVEGYDAASASGDKNEITIGRERLEKISPIQLVKTSVHEVIGHLVRAQGAKSQNDPALRLPQSGNLAFEEGLATAIEQIVTGETRIAGEQYYLSLGLQLGLDRSGDRRDFRDTFEIMWRRAIVESMEKGKKITRELAQDRAYMQVMRRNRGGALDARDISYFEGSRYAYAWMNQTALLDEASRQDALRIVLSGRFDATDPTQWNKFKDAHAKRSAT